MTTYDISLVGDAPPPKTYKIGDVFYSEADDCLLLLAQVDSNECCLITLSGDGNRQRDPILIDNIFGVTEAELREMVDGRLQVVDDVHIRCTLGERV